MISTLLFADVGELGGSTTGDTYVYDEGTVIVMYDIEGNEFCLVGPPSPHD